MRFESMELLKKKSLKVLILSILAFIFFFEGKFKQLEDNTILTVEGISKQILGKKIEVLKKTKFLRANFTIEDTILSYEEVEWKALFFKKNNSLIFIAESNWQDSTIISRITIVSPIIKYKNCISVNSNFKDISNIIDKNNLNSLPDGYVGFISKENSNVTFLMNIDSHPELTNGVPNFNSIPKDIKVESIVITPRVHP